MRADAALSPCRDVRFCTALSIFLPPAPMPPSSRPDMLRFLIASFALRFALLPGAAMAAPVYQAGVPYAVVIGDSIAEGEPQRKGRLNVFGQFEPQHPSLPGQLSYELAVRHGVFHFNHGMGGQSSTQVRARWLRDAMAEEVEVGDGRPSRTLPAGTTPSTIFLHVGINDIAQGVTLATLQENFTYFAQSAAQRRIALVVDNIGAWLGMAPEQIAVARAFNTWLQADLAERYGNVTVVDYLHWSSGGTGDFRVLAPGLFADGVHPSIAGYASLADYVQRSLGQPAPAASR